MKVLGEVGNQELFWVEPRKAPSIYELQAGKDKLATLFWEAKYSVVAETAHGRLHFRREGVINQRNSVREFETGKEIAIYKPAITNSGGRLMLLNGHNFVWRNNRFWGSHKVWYDDQGTPLVSFQTTNLRHIPVSIEARGALLPELDLLVSFGCYLLLLGYRDTSQIAAKPPRTTSQA